MSDAKPPVTLVRLATGPVLADLRALGPRYATATAVVERVLADGTLGTHLTPKTFNTLAREILDSLPIVQGDDDAD